MKVLTVEEVTQVVYDVASWREASQLAEHVKRLAKSHETLREQLEAAMRHVDTAHEALTKIRKRVLT